MHLSRGFSYDSHSVLEAHPVHSMGSPSLPRPLLAHNDVLWCRTIPPAFHRLRLVCPRLRTRLTLGRLTLPRNPQAFGVSGSDRDDATHSGILSSLRSTCPCDQASRPRERSPTMTRPVSLSGRTDEAIHSFGTMLEPRYVVGATALDQ